jgi:DNA sulfur modification protein DndB
MPEIVIEGLLGLSASREVLLGFAPASLLHLLSFADILEEDTGRGYQRRFNPQHSLDFRKYIQSKNSSTIPLTLNLRPRTDNGWILVRSSPNRASLIISGDTGKVFTQVDCQHRLGFLADLTLTLPFMCYLGLSEREEMEVFNTINSKAKGLSTSLLDFHDARLAGDLAKDRPELFIALQLNNNDSSPWFRQLDLGGAKTSGLQRRASLRTMQKAIKRFIQHTRRFGLHSPEAAAQIVIDFWSCTATLLRQEWDNPRHHLITKGVGVYALMSIAADLYEESVRAARACDRRFLMGRLSEFLNSIDWSSTGPLKGLGGEAGVKTALSYVRSARIKSLITAVPHG